MSDPLVSVIVPAYNSERTIKRCIDSLLNIDYQNYEIIVVDDGSSDKTKDVLLGFKERIRLIQSQHFGPSKCRNIATKEAKGDLVAFTDSDCLVHKNWLKELVKGFTQDKVAGVGGIQLSPDDETNFGRKVQTFFELTGFLGGYIKDKKNRELTVVPHNPSCNAIYRKEVFLRIGGFDEGLWPCEDVDLDYRLKKNGFIFMFNPKAIVYHYRPQSIKALLKMMSRYGYVQGILTKRYGFFRKIQILPVIFLILIILFLLTMYSFWLLLFFCLVLLIKLRNPIISFHVFLISMISAFIWNLGFLRGILSSRK